MPHRAEGGAAERPPPLYCSPVRMHKRAEIDVQSVAKTMRASRLAVTRSLQKLFSTAANNARDRGRLQEPPHHQLFQTWRTASPAAASEETAAFVFSTALQKPEGKSGRPSAPHRKAS